jgi:tRNA pseudouridine55 synthase
VVTGKNSATAAASHGLLVVDKPEGPTSHDVVDRVRRLLGTRRVGHTGTLDPFATGVLPVCVGRATRLARFLAESDKTYLGEVRFGFATTTDDRLGEALGTVRAVRLDRATLEAACAAFRGERLQVPPTFSARRVAGQRLYDLARAGVEAERRAVPVRIERLLVRRQSEDVAEIEVRCSAGTYVRAIARDLGQALGVGAHLVSLRRLEAAGFDVERALPLASLCREVALAALIPLEAMLPGLPEIRVGAEGREAVRHGRLLTRSLVVSGFPEDAAPDRVRVLDAQERLLALATPRGFGFEAPGLRVEPSFHPDVVLCEGD